MSFGFKHGVPTPVDMILDVRFLPNPFFVPALKNQTGRSKKIQNFLRGQKALPLFLKKTTSLLEFVMGQYEEAGRPSYTVAIGCTGGKHRSVAVVELLKPYFRRKKLGVRVSHRDIHV